MAANVAKTKLKPVSGQRKLMSLFDIKMSRQRKNKRLKKNAEQDLRVGRAGLADAEDFAGGDAVHVADVRHAFFQQHDAGGFKREADQQNQKQFYHNFEPQIRRLHADSKQLSRLTANICY